MRFAVPIVLAVAAMQVPAAPPTGVITGRVVDEFGDPEISARVIAEPPPSTGRAPRTLTPTTDDRGEYRLTRLPAGACVVSVMRLGGTVMFSAAGTIVFVAPGGRPVPQRVYFPNAASATDAEVLRIAAGEERADVDFVLPAAQPSLPLVAATRIAQAGTPQPNPDANNR